MDEADHLVPFLDLDRRVAFAGVTQGTDTSVRNERINGGLFEMEAIHKPNRHDENKEVRP
jgi:hypothetical protein